MMSNTRYYDGSKGDVDFSMEDVAKVIKNPSNYFVNSALTTIYDKNDNKIGTLHDSLTKSKNEIVTLISIYYEEQKEL